MGRFFGSRTLLIICGALLILLSALLGSVQYRWSARVAAADAQREKEHLDAAASLFASDFNAVIGQTLAFLQNEAWAALRTGEPLQGMPKLIGQLYYVDAPEQGAPKAERLTVGGRFESAALPEWIAIPHCAPVAIEQPFALVVPIVDAATIVDRGATGMQVMRTFKRRPDRCFVARIDQAYLRDTLFTELILRSFGATSVRDYDFAVVSLSRPRDFFPSRPASWLLPDCLPARAWRRDSPRCSCNMSSLLSPEERRTWRACSVQASGNWESLTRECHWLPPSSRPVGAIC
jgi:hypothetical protein